MLTTRFTELVGCKAPIQLAGMGSHANPRMAAAVANAGGLGMVSVYGGYGGPPKNVAKMLDETCERTSGAFGANFIMHFVQPEIAHETVRVAAAHAPLVEFFYTEPDPALIEIVHSEGALACWQVGSRKEAIAAENAGCDLIVAQGVEAGGHVRGTIGLLALLVEVLEAVDVPVVAAGGIGSGRMLATVLAAGADGARVGTRFLAVAEADALPHYVDALIEAEAEDTIYTDTFSVGWPINAPHRLLRSSLDAAQSFKGEIVGTSADNWRNEPYDVRPFSTLAIHESATGHIEAMSQWAGESVGSVRRVETADDIVRELVGEAEKLLRRFD